MIADGAGDAEAGGERAGPLDVRVGDAGDRDAGQVGEGGEMGALGPEAGAHDADRGGSCGVLLLGCEGGQDLGGGRRPDAGAASEVRQHAVEGSDAMRLADDPRVEGDGQDAAAAVLSPRGRAADRRP